MFNFLKKQDNKDQKFIYSFSFEEGIEEYPIIGADKENIFYKKNNLISSIPAKSINKEYSLYYTDIKILKKNEVNYYKTIIAKSVESLKKLQ